MTEVDATGLLIVGLLLGFLLALGLSVSIGSMVSAGIASAREPANRATSASPWEFFDQAAQRKRRKHLIVWSVAVLILWMSWMIILVDDEPPDLMSLLYNTGSATMAPVCIIGLGFLTSAAYAILTPLFQNLWVRALASAMLSIFSYALIGIGLHLIVPEFLIIQKFYRPADLFDPFGGSLPLTAYIVLPVSALISHHAWGIARFQAAKWFRFGE